MKKNSFLFQITLLDQRFKQQQQMIWDDSNDIVVQDRTIFEDPIFAKVYI
jgi:deoxyadenosine/deoxycytidine kinase